MENLTRYLLMITVLTTACKQNKKEKEKIKAVTPVLSFIQSQVAQVDSSVFAIKKIEYRDSLPADTTDIHRDQFRGLAKDFLEIPDISTSEYKDRYEEKQNYDPDLDLVSLITLPKEPANAEILKQQVIIKPDTEGGKMKTIYIDREWVTKDSSVIKKMIWEVDNYFQVLTLKQLPGQPETSHVLRVTWKDFTKNE